VYDIVQRAAGVAQTRALLRPYFSQIGDSSVVDVGAGTGVYADLVPAEATYVGVDVDARKLKRISDRWPERTTVVGDATRSPVPSLAELVDLHERMSLKLRPAKVACVALNTSPVSDAEAGRAIAAAEEETGLPADDPVRYGAAKLLDVVV
jgi:hypothetical protein